MKLKLVIYWCCRDFRLTDNPALTAAIEHSQKNQIFFLPIFILDSNIFGNLENHENFKNYSENQQNNVKLEKNQGDSKNNLNQKNLSKNQKDNDYLWQNFNPNSNLKESFQGESSQNPLEILKNPEKISTDNSKLKTSNSEKSFCQNNNSQINLQTKFPSNSEISNLQNNSAHFSSHLHGNIGFPRRLFLSRVLASFSLQFPVFEILIGDYQEIFESLSRIFELQVFANSDVEPFSRFRDEKVAQILGNNFQTFADQMTVSPDLRTQTGQVYSIFTPFKNAALESFLNARTLPKADLNMLPNFSDFTNLNFNNLKENSEPILNQNSNEKQINSQTNSDILRKIKELFPNFPNSQNSESFKNKNSQSQNSQSQIKKIEIDFNEENGKNSQKPNSQINQKGHFENYRLEKKLNFSQLQIQILAIIDTDWNFCVVKHFAKNKKVEDIDKSELTKMKLVDKNGNKTGNGKNEKAQNSENSENIQNQLFGNGVENGNFHSNFWENQSNSGFISEVFKENQFEFHINLDKILKRPDFLEWKWVEAEVLADFDNFLENKILNYKENRDDLALDTVNSGQTSKISYALKWGLVSARFLKQKIVDKFGLQTQSQVGIVHFISELMWREFYRYVLFHEPLILNLEFQSRFRTKLNSEKITEIKAKLNQEKIAKILNLKTEK